MKGDLTQGPVMKTMLLFAVPMILGNLLQQCYNVVDTLIVGRFLGPDALAAVGSAFALMTFLTSILLGLSMGSSAVFSIHFGRKDFDGLKNSIFTSFFFVSGCRYPVQTPVRGLFLSRVEICTRNWHISSIDSTGTGEVYLPFSKPLSKV